MIQRIRTTFERIPELFTPTFLRKDAPPYKSDDFRADIQAGITVAIILIPQAMALALLAGLPAIYGLYASLPGFIASIWGSSRHLSTGPVAIVSFLVMTSLIPFAEPGSPEFITLAAILALLVGLLQLLMGVLRLGFFMQLIPHSAIAGFSSAAALIIIVTQIPTLFGFEIARHEFVYQNIWEIITNIHHTSLFSLGVGVMALILLVCFRPLPRTFPATLIVLLLGIFATFVFRLDQFGVALVAGIPRILPTFSFPAVDFHTIFSLLPKAAIVAFVGFVEAHAIAKSVAVKTGQHLETNRELVGQGLANIAGGLFKGYPVSGSFLRTAVNFEAGARTGVAAVVTAVITIVVLLFFGPVLELLPRAVLAAIVIMSALSLVDLQKLRDTYFTFRADGIVAYATFAMAFILKPDDAIFIGIVVALILFLRKTVWGAQVVELGIDREWNVLRSLDDQSRVEAVSGCLIVRPGMSLYYGNATHLMEQIRDLLSKRRGKTKPVRSLVIDCSGVNFVDITGLEVMSEYIRDFKAQGISVSMIYVRQTVLNVLEKAHDFPDVMILHNIAEMKNWCEVGQENNTLTIARSKPARLRRTAPKPAAS